MGLVLACTGSSLGHMIGTLTVQALISENSFKQAENWQKQEWNDSSYKHHLLYWYRFCSCHSFWYQKPLYLGRRCPQSILETIIISLLSDVVPHLWHLGGQGLVRWCTTHNPHLAMLWLSPTPNLEKLSRIFLFVCFKITKYKCAFSKILIC